MDKLKHADVRIVDDAFIRGGYVLDFSNTTFQEFFDDEFDVDIYSDRYGVDGGSKGWRLRTFVKVEYAERPLLVAEVLRALWSHSEDEAFEGRGTAEGQPDEDGLRRKLFRLVARLESNGPAPSAVREEGEFEATGVRKDYALDPKPIGRGGAASVFAATHKGSGVRVALKKILHAHSEDARARMQREIEVCRALAENDGVVDLIDADPGNTWYVMRLADGDLNAFRGRLSTADVVELFQQIGAGLSEAHEKGFLHRDLKPANILRFGARWVVADWGLVRRPRGDTTSDRTQIGSFYGTEGFAAPEAWRDAHRMGPASDVYALGQILGWIPDGASPVPNLPPTNPGRWSVPVGSATQMNPEHRPGLEDLILAVARAGAPPPPGEMVDEMASAALDPDRASTIDAELALSLARQVPGQRMLFDILPRLSSGALRVAIRAEPALAMDVARAYGMSGELEWGRRDFDYANEVVETVLLFAHEAAGMKDASLLAVATSALLGLDERWDRYPAREAIRGWLAGLSGEGARVVAKALSGRAAEQKSELMSGISGRSDPAILAALRS
ncbi:MAG: serine/threonine-protein kinase [Nannocystales bacterium]